LIAARWLQWPVDAASLVAFRVSFGVVSSAAMLRLLGKGWLAPLFVSPAYHFSYPGLGWVRPLPSPFMQAAVVALAAAALAVAAGWRTRAWAAVLAVGLAYLEAIDRALYLNHYYLAGLLAALLVLLAPRTATVPAWALAAFRVQVGAVYVFAGLAKLNRDWLLHAQPLRAWLASRADLPIVGPWLERPAVAFAASWAGAGFDLAIVPLLLWRRTRWWAFGGVVAFHLATGLLFPIGMFPFIMTAAATLLLPPDWPRRLRIARAAADPPRPEPTPRGEERVVVPGLVAVHLVVQLLLPLRQHLAAVPSAWTGRGFNFAWNVMVAERSGSVLLNVVDRASGRRETVRPARDLTAIQEAAMAQDPELIVVWARDVARAWRREGRVVAIYADAWASLNGRPGRRLLDPNVDLTTAVEPPVLPWTD